MWTFKSIRSKLMAFGALALALLLSAVGTGWLSAERLTDATLEVKVISAALQHQQSADMMHDAIRGDVLAALLAVAKNEVASVAQVRTELVEHVKEFREQLAGLDGLPLDAELKQKVAAVRPALDAYARVAGELIAVAQGGATVEKPQLNAFSAQFKQLEDAMGTLSDDIHSRNDERIQHAREVTSWARTTLMGVAALAAVVLLTLSSLLARGIDRPIAQAVRLAQAVTAGHLTVDNQIKTSDETAQLLRSLNEMSGSLSTIVQQVRGAADTINVASVEIAAGNQDLSARTEQAASNLEETAASMEQLTSTVKNSADAARQANQLAANASEVAVRGGQVVSQVVATMDEINHSSKKISDIIGTIDGIAFQTNILALNAAVEAARAGEQGRGFAVVAGEVRNLAQRSAEAAKEIKGLIGSSVEKVETGTRLVADAGQTMSEIVGSIQRVSDIVGEITASAGEQSDGIGQVNTAVSQLDQMTQQNAALVEQSAAAAESLKDQASRLAQLVAVFRIDGSGSGLAAASAVQPPKAVPV